MTTSVFPSFGYRHTTQTYADDIAAIGYTVDNGHGQHFKAIASLKPLLDRVASGEAIQLSDADRGYLGRMGVQMRDVSIEVRQNKARASLDAGVPIPVINATTALDSAPHYRAEKPIKFIAAFRVAS